MIKTLKVLSAAILVAGLGFPYSAQAAFNDVTFSADVTVNLSGPDYDLTIVSGGQVAGYVVGTTTLAFNMESGSSVVIRSTDFLNLVNDGNGDVVCEATYSQITLTSTSTETITITPAAAGVCAATPSSGGGGGGGDDEDETPTTPVIPGTVHPLGTNIKDSSGTVFTVTTENSTTVRRPYTSWGAFMSYGFNSQASIVDANSGDLALSVGSFISPQDGSVICSDRGSDIGTCYFITQGQKAGFTSAPVFTGQGFDFDNTQNGDVSFLVTITPISSSTARHLPGALINNSGTYQIVGNTGLLGFPSASVFSSWGYSFAKAVTANTADTALTQTGVVSGRIAGQIRLFY